jgi:hypothetical protein
VLISNVDASPIFYCCRVSQEYEKYEASKAGGGRMASQADDVEYYKKMAQICLAFGVGIVVGLNATKKN